MAGAQAGGRGGGMMGAAEVREHAWRRESARLRAAVVRVRRRRELDRDEHALHARPEVVAVRIPVATEFIADASSILRFAHEQLRPKLPPAQQRERGAVAAVVEGVVLLRHADVHAHPRQVELEL